MSAILIWDRDVNRRALSRRGADRDGSAKLPDAFFDADQPESGMRRLCHVETVAVVLHCELDPVVPVRQREADPTCMGVFRAIGQCFLDDTIDVRALTVVQLCEFTLNRDADRRAGPLRELARLPLQRGAEAEIVEH